MSFSVNCPSCSCHSSYSTLSKAPFRDTFKTFLKYSRLVCWLPSPRVRSEPGWSHGCAAVLVPSGAHPGRLQVMAQALSPCHLGSGFRLAVSPGLLASSWHSPDCYRRVGEASRCKASVPVLLSLSSSSLSSCSFKVINSFYFMYSCQCGINTEGAGLR